MDYGDKIRVARKNKGFTQKELADKIGKSVRMLQKYESGEVVPQLEMFHILADVLGVEFGELIRQPSSTSLFALLDWLEVAGYKLRFFDEEEGSAWILSDMNGPGMYSVTDDEIAQLNESIAAYTRFQAHELLMRAKDRSEAAKEARAHEALEDPDFLAAREEDSDDAKT